MEFQRYRIVKPGWVVESVKAGRLLPWHSFRVVDEGVGQKVLGFDNGQVISQTNNGQNGYRDQTDTSWYTSQVKDVVDTLNTQTYPQISALSTTTSQLQVTAPEELHKSSDSNVAHEHFQTEPNAALQLHDEDPQLLETAFESSSESAGSRAKDLKPNGPREASDVHMDQPLGDVTISLPQEANQEDLLINDMASITKEAREAADLIRSPDKPSKKAPMTAEEHNAVLLSDPRMRKSSTVNPDFLKQYYQESRLHHLSTWKAELKAQLQALTQEKSSTQKAKQKRIPGARRYVLHVDFDSFFAAVSLRKHPELIEKPVVVAHGSGSGSEIASCNYPARKFGVKNGMWMKTAVELCPDLNVLPYDFKAYEEASRHFYDAILATNGIVQSVSIDEALIDISAQCLPVGGSDGKGVSEGSMYREQAKADEIALGLRNLIKEKTGCAVSVGIGGNVLLAKVALKKAKPAGQYHVKPDEALDFLGPLTVQDLPGVAYSIGGKLEEIGVKFVNDIRELNKERLVSTLGPKTGEKLWDYSRGIDRTEVGEQVVRKSVSAEVNWGIRFVTQAQADEFVQSLCDELHRRLTEQNVKGRQLTMKIMRRAVDAPLDPPKHLGHGKCDTFNKSIVLGVATNAKDVLGREAVCILKGFGFSPGELRGLGVQMTKLEPLKQPNAASLESSQRRIQFKSPAAPPKKAVDTPDPIEDMKSPHKPLPPNISQHVETVVGAIENDLGSARPLNIMGTQFLLPTQIDPQVLAELPEDIRKAFVIQMKDASAEDSRAASPDEGTRYSSSAIPSAIPRQSQLDPEALDALPEDVRAEVVGFYADAARKGVQQVLPQSPRKPYTSFKSSTKLTTPTKKKKKSSNILFRNALSKSNAVSTLTQSNFLASRTAKGASGAVDSAEEDYESADVSNDILEALPEDIRREILEQQKRDRLKKRAGLDLGTRKKKVQQQPELSGTEAGQRLLRIPPGAEKPTFTAKKLSALHEVRDAVSAWFDEFREDGPFDEDVDALVTYLRRVILDERDLEKAVSLANWLGWLVSQASESVQDAWVAHSLDVQEGVQDAVRERGLGPVEFG